MPYAFRENPDDGIKPTIGAELRNKLTVID